MPYLKWSSILAVSLHIYFLNPSIPFHIWSVHYILPSQSIHKIYSLILWLFREDLLFIFKQICEEEPVTLTADCLSQFISIFFFICLFSFLSSTLIQHRFANSWSTLIHSTNFQILCCFLVLSLLGIFFIMLKSNA